MHALEPDGCCPGCASRIYLEQSSAGKGQVAGGVAVALASAATALVAAGLKGLVPTAVIAGLLVLVAGGTGAALWGGLIAPRLVRRRLRAGLVRPAELPPANRD